MSHHNIAILSIISYTVIRSPEVGLEIHPEVGLGMRILREGRGGRSEVSERESAQLIGRDERSRGPEACGGLQGCG